jgi:class 3 adenylate cyclase
MSLGSILDVPEEADQDSIVARLGESGQRTVLALDTYERFGLMDTWLRQVFVPSLKENVFTIIAGRQPPNPGWLTSPGWQDLFREIEVRELSASAALKMMESRGLAPSQAERVQSFARGYPLVLEMAAAAILTQPDLEITHGPPPKLLEQLTSTFLSGLPPETVEAVEAASTVRRLTEPLLRAILAISDVREIFDNLQSLPFVDVTTEGLIFHDVVHDTISKDLAWRDPEQYRTYRRRAWHFCSEESHQCVGGSLWPCTADLLYLIENPVVREAFFPKGVTDFRVEPATSSDGEDINHIVVTTESEVAAQLIMQWWERHPETFSVVKTPDGRLAAFYSIFEPNSVDLGLLAEDPLTAAWSAHLNENPLAEGERVLFLRRWLASATGEAPSPAQGACWLDIKRTYMELRPSLRRLYTTVTDLPTYVPIVIPLGFAPLESGNVELGGVTYNSAILDFGPSSVDGWIANLVCAELGMETSKAGEIVPERSRQLHTLLFTDIVGSTEKAVELGDRTWRDLLERHNSLIRAELAKFQGREIDTAGDGFFASFNSPAQGIGCACAISESVRQLGIDIRAGMHLSECEEIEGRIRGIGVHIGARVAASARPGEILVSRTISDAVAGSEIRFEDRGAHVLKGIPGEWHLFAVEQSAYSLT